MAKLNDQDVVLAEYASEAAFAVRSGAYRWSKGPDPRLLAVEAVAAVHPRRVLDAGCGPGSLTAQLAARTKSEVVGLDRSARMVDLTRARGLTAVLGDIEALPFANGEFDAVMAAWVLYHCSDLTMAVAEISRVLRPRGTLVAVTSGSDHWRQLYELLQVEREQWSFSGENGADVLGRYFARVERIDASGVIDFPDREAVLEFVRATISLRHASDRLPAFDGALRVRRSSIVFVAEK
jgi:SAM-dependent methyltransferase